MPLFGLLFCYLAGFDVTFGTETICDGQAAGDDSQEVSVFTRIQIQAESSPVARTS